MMSEAILVCVISGAITLLGTIITVMTGNSKIQQELARHNDVQDEKIQQLTRKVELHNSVIERMYIAETEIKNIKENMKKE